jgi:hypothetical protein
MSLCAIGLESFFTSSPLTAFDVTHDDDRRAENSELHTLRISPLASDGARV